MSKSLIIAEKPSVAQDLVRALTPQVGKFDKHAEHFENDRYVITSAVGHLLEIAAPEEYDVKRGKWSFAHLPVVPPHFDLVPLDKTKTRLQAVVRLAKRKDVTELINACDAGREGELIFRQIERYAAGGKGTLGKPVKRLWLQSMTPQAIRDAFGELRTNEQMQGLADAARSRSEADWLVGINGTRAMTAFNSREGGFFLTTVGRVQTPTLSIVVEREEKIRAHVAREYWELKATFDAAQGTYEGKWFDPAWKRGMAAGDGGRVPGSGEGPDPDARADRLWNVGTAEAVAAACRGQPAVVTEESKPSTQASPGLYDLTTLQREANSRFGFSAKTTLSIAQALYERHKLITYPRTDSRHLPQDYVPVATQTFEMLASAHLPAPMRAINAHAALGLKEGYVKPSKRIFDNAKVSDHFAIIPTTQPPAGALSEVELKLYDLIVKRFIAVFYPAAESLVTTRTSRVKASAGAVASHEGHYHFVTTGKVLVKPGWLAVYGKEAQETEGSLVPVAPGEVVRTEAVDVVALVTKPPARYTEATLLSAMEGAGKLIDDDELREAMAEKGLGTPATRAATIEGLVTEKYLLRDGRELIPTAKAFQLMTLLRGLEVEDLTRPDLTGQWEHALAQIEHGRRERHAFMSEIAQMAERIVRKAKEFDGETIPGNYATLSVPCPNCGGVVKENYRRYTCVGQGADAAARGTSETGCGFSITKIPAGRAFELAEVEQFLRDKRIGPLEGFRSKAGWPFTAELALVRDDESDNWKLEFDFGEDQQQADAEPVDFSGAAVLGHCPKCGSKVHEHGTQYVCDRAVGPSPTCDFKSGKIILQQPISAEEMGKLLHEGKTSLLTHFISNKTRRPFKAFLAYDPKQGKVVFEFEPRPAGKTAARGGRGAGAAGGADATATADAGGGGVAAPGRGATRVAARRSVDSGAGAGDSPFVDADGAADGADMPAPRAAARTSAGQAAGAKKVPAKKVAAKKAVAKKAAAKKSAATWAAKPGG